MKTKHFLPCLLALMGSATLKAYDFVIDGLSYDILSQTEKTVSVAGQTMDHAALVIPSEVTHDGVTYSVTAIAEKAFYWQYAHTDDITSLTLPEGIKEIGDWAFANNRISEINIPASVEHIGLNAFGGTWYYHYGPDNEDYYQVYYPENYTVSNDNSFYSSYKGILYDKEKTKLIDCPDGYSGDIYLPSSLKEIPSGAFGGRNSHNLYIYNLSRFCEIDVTGSILSIGYGKFGNIYYWGKLPLTDYNQWITVRNTLSIPSDVTRIGRGIFYGCKSFTDVSFPTNGVTEIGDYAFACTKITDVTLPATIQTIGQNAFYMQWYEQSDIIEYDEDGDPYHPYITRTMEMDSLVIPKNVQSIGSNAFNLTSGATVTSKSATPSDITSNAFKNASNCTLAVGQGLQSTYSGKTGWNAFGTISEDESIIPYIDGEVFTATTAEGIEMTFKVLSAANKTAQVGDGSNPAIDPSFDGDLVIPSQINGLSVTDVGCKAFINCQNLQSVEIQEGIRNLGQNGSDRNWTYGPFYGAKIAHSVTLPNTLTFIGMVSFYNAEIGSITFPSSLNSISLWAFKGAKIGSLNIPYSETDLYCYYDKSSGTNYEVFEGAQIGTLTLDRVISPDQYPPFIHTAIEELRVGPNGHAVISSWCRIQDYYPKAEETLCMNGDYSNSIAFSTNQTYCRNVHLPEGYVTIQKVLSGTIYMNIPSTVTTVSADAGISLYQPIVLPAGIQFIGDNAITEATSVTALGEYPIDINEAAFSSYVYKKTLYVPSGAKERYESATGWSKFANIVEMGDLGNPIQFADECLKRICVRNYDINGDGELSEGEAALVTSLYFYDVPGYNNGQSSITSFNEISYFTGLTSISDYALSGWSSLTSISIPGKVTTIGRAFGSCVGLTDVFCHAESVPETSPYAFDVSAIASATLHVPAGSVETYQTTEPWSTFGTIAPIFDEESSKPFPAGTYAKADLKRTFAEGWNTICLPFGIDNIEGVFGTGAKAYGFDDFADGELKFSQVTSLAAGTPYVIYVPAEITDLIAFENIVVEESNTVSSSIDKNGVFFRGTYAPIAAGEWTKANSTDDIYGLTADGRIRKAGTEASILGFRGYFDIPAGTEVKGFVFGDDATGIDDIEHSSLTIDHSIYNLAGQRLNKAQKGINIINGKKILK